MKSNNISSILKVRPVLIRLVGAPVAEALERLHLVPCPVLPQVHLQVDDVLPLAPAHHGHTAAPPAGGLPGGEGAAVSHGHRLGVLVGQPGGQVPAQADR